MGWAIIFFLLFITFYYPPTASGNLGLDASYLRALCQASLNGLAHGRDVIFTYGPLGCYSNMEYLPGIFDAALWHRGILSAGVALCGTLAIHRVPGTLPRTLLFLILLAITLRWGAGDPAYLFSALFAILAALRSRNASPLVAAIAMAWLLWLALVKASFLILALGGGFLMASHILHVRGYRSTLSWILVVTLYLLIAWTQIGQPLNALPAYLWHGISIAGGFGNAMGAPGPMSELLLFLGAIGLLLLGMILAESGWRVEPQLWLTAAATALVIFLAFKQGFVRHDVHAFQAFSAVAAMPFLFLRESSRHKTRQITQQLALLGGSALALIGAFQPWSTQPFLEPTQLAAQWNQRVLPNFRALLNPSDTRQASDAHYRQVSEETRLPQIREIVQGVSVDVMTYSLAVPLMNEFTWRPRPVIQSYSAYTSDLAALNAAYLRGKNAPTFLLLDWRTIDQRLPTMDDGPALLEILRWYEPVGYEGDYLLVERRPTPVTSTTMKQLLYEGPLETGQPFNLAALGSEPKILQLSWTPTLCGRLRGLLLRFPIVYIQMEFASGTNRRYRIVPTMLEPGVLIDPLPLQPGARFLTSGSLQSPTKLFLEAPGPCSLHAQARIKLWSAPWINKVLVE